MLTGLSAIHGSSPKNVPRCVGGADLPAPAPPWAQGNNRAPKNRLVMPAASGNSRFTCATGQRILHAGPRARFLIRYARLILFCDTVESDCDQRLGKDSAVLTDRSKKSTLVNLSQK